MSSKEFIMRNFNCVVRAAWVFVVCLFSFHRGTAQTDTAKVLKEATVTARKPMFEQKTDRMVIHVKNSIASAGGTALDVLERSPGIMVNRQANSIAINGKNGVAVMINGKMNYMPADALVPFLAGISTGDIEKIEVITTPP